jgi:hypothetical protein
MANPVITNINNRANILGPFTKKIEKTILQDASGVIPSGSVMGIISVGAITAAAKSGGNTGNGTCTVLTVKDGAKAGIYTVRIIRVATHIFDFEVKNPNGDQIGFGTVEGTGATFVFTKEIQFTITDGSTDFIKGDGFDITVAAGSGKLKRCDSTAVDGSQYPKYILVEETDATAADVIREVVYSTNVREDFLVFKGAETLATDVDGNNFRYHLAQTSGDSGGILCISGTSLTAYDNQ